MKIAKRYKLEKLGVVVVDLPVKRDKEDVTGSLAYSRDGGVVARCPVELNSEDTCKKPAVFFSNVALQVGRVEMEKDGEGIIVPLVENKAKTLEAEFELHAPCPKENGLLTVATMEGLFPDSVKDPVCVLNVADLKLAADTLGAKDVAIYESKDLLLIRDSQFCEGSRIAQVVIPKAATQSELPLD